ncbi:hypothetical protein V6U71_09460 [Sphingopyxis sp. J-6]|uniref:hypothetical protein n=1 Tax=Sphingopyxis sp. J-6 TaxID=3122054 RepID=UPI003983FDFE
MIVKSRANNLTACVDLRARSGNFASHRRNPPVPHADRKRAPIGVTGIADKQI